MRQVQPVVFAPHPGKVIFHAAWNGTSKTEDASKIPDAVKFVYRDGVGAETSDFRVAVTRIPVVEVWTISLDAAGKSVAPSRATNFSITEYGPEHTFLRHTTASAGPSREAPEARSRERSDQ